MTARSSTLSLLFRLPRGAFPAYHFDMLKITEIYTSLEGESSWVGLPCTLVRLTGCDLRCSYCDTTHAFTGGREMTLEAVANEVLLYPAPLVLVTGGEPLLQAECPALITRLLDAPRTVLLETNGARPIDAVDRRAHVILDLKCPSSGEQAANRLENLPLLKPGDELKFVISTHEDYDWAVGMMEKHRLADRCRVLFSWATPGSHAAGLKPGPRRDDCLTLEQLADRVVADTLDIRLLPQLHKVIWGADAKAK